MIKFLKIPGSISQFKSIFWYVHNTEMDLIGNGARKARHMFAAKMTGGVRADPTPMGQPHMSLGVAREELTCVTPGGLGGGGRD